MTDRAKSGLHMTADEFRRHGHAVVDWLANYFERVESLPVLSQVNPGDIRALLPQAPPERGEAFATILDDVDRVLMPGITHWQSPNFYAFFPSNNSGPSILGELASAGLAVQGMIAFGFMAFMLFTSNPFDRIAPPPDGQGLNPLLQDPGLAFHPPFLYFGYVGLSIAFSFAVAALIEGKVDAAWACCRILGCQ